MGIYKDFKNAKVVFAGQTNVGKSSLVYNFDQDGAILGHSPENLFLGTESQKRVNNAQFDPIPTIGAAFVRKRIIRNDELITLDIWDTAGQERFHSISRLYFRNTQYCILVFDVTDANTFNDLNIWKRLCDNAESNIIDTVRGVLRESIKNSNILNGNVTYFLVGNKIDKGPRAVPEEDIRDFCQRNNITSYIETSAITGDGVATLYEEIVNHIYTNGTAATCVITSVIDQRIPASNSYCSC